MFEIVNEYSFVLISVGVVLVTGALLYWRRRSWRLSLGVSGTVAAAVLVGYLLLRGFLVTDVSDLDRARALIGGGKPTFIEFYSNYCTGCLSLSPFVDNLVSQINDQFSVLRVDIHTVVGRALRQELGFNYTPEFVLFDASGREVWRGHLPPTDDELALAGS